MRLSDKDRRILNHLPPELGVMKFGDVLASIAEDAASGAKGVSTDIATATNGAFANASEVAIVLNEICKGEGPTQRYSVTPNRIGTWIDGSPIFRIAFDVLLKDMSDGAYDELLGSEAFTVDVGNQDATLINALCYYYGSDEYYPSGIKFASSTLIDFAVPDGVTIPEDQSDCTDERYYGYIDFIKTGGTDE